MSTFLFEYIWIDGAGNTRSKTKVDCNSKYNVESLKDLLSLLPLEYDGSSTNQATTEDSEVILRPVRLQLTP